MAKIQDIQGPFLDKKVNPLEVQDHADKVLLGVRHRPVAQTGPVFASQVIAMHKHTNVTRWGRPKEDTLFFT